MSHYFTNEENLKENPRIISYEFGGKAFKFHTNSGVFSPEKVDFASNLLVESIVKDIENHKINAEKMLDLACGYGPIGIILGKNFNCDITMCDVNRRALDLAKVNCKESGVNAEIFESDGFSQVAGKFDVITLNPPIRAGKEVYYKMYEDASKHLSLGGKFYIVIQKKHGANSTIARLSEIFKSFKTLYKKKGYYVLACQN